MESTRRYGQDGKLPRYVDQNHGLHLGSWEHGSQVHPEAVANRLSSSMSGLPFTRDARLVPLTPLGIDRNVLEDVAIATLTLTSLIERVCWSAADTPHELAKLAGLSVQQLPLLGAGGKKDEVRFSSCNVRPDVILVNGTAKFLECNFGAANSNPISSHVLNSTYASIYGPLPPPSPGHAAGILEARSDFYRKVSAERNLDPRIALLGSTREADLTDVRYLQVEPEYLRKIGIESSYIEPEQLDSNPSYWSVVQKHFLPEEWARLGILSDSVRRAHETCAFFVSDSGLSLSSKLVLAWLSSGKVPLSPSENDFVARHLPWTRELAPGSVEFHGSDYELLELARLQQRRFVLKPANACGGNGVVFGRAVTQCEWESRLRAACTTGPHVLQEYMQPDPATMIYWDRQERRSRNMEVDYVVGPYVVDGTNAGFTVCHVPRGENAPVNFANGAALNTVVPIS